MKTSATITGNKQLICLLLALLLAIGNVAYSAHVSKHNITDTGFCSLCIHPGSPGSAIVNQAGPLFIDTPSLALNRIEPTVRCPRVARYANQSRAPPRIA